MVTFEIQAEKGTIDWYLNLPLSEALEGNFGVYNTDSSLIVNIVDSQGPWVGAGSSESIQSESIDLSLNPVEKQFHLTIMQLKTKMKTFLPPRF